MYFASPGADRVLCEEILGGLGPILGHFGGHLGVQNIAPVLAGVVFGENSRF